MTFLASALLLCSSDRQSRYTAVCSLTTKNWLQTAVPAVQRVPCVVRIFHSRVRRQLLVRTVNGQCTYEGSVACFKARDVDRSQWLSSYGQRSRPLVRFGNLRVSVSAAGEAMCRRTVKADHSRASVGTGVVAYEQPAERLPELAAHGAVDEEVDEIAEKDAEVDDAGSYRR